MQTLLITVEIKSNHEGFILEVMNTITQKKFECKNVGAMNEIVTTLYNLYPDNELEVAWLKSPLAYPHHINEVREQIIAFEKENNISIE